MMKLISKILKKPYRYDYLKALYNNPNTLIDLEFYNREKRTKELWVEPTCVSIQLDPETEYKLVTHEKCLRFEYEADGRVILYLQQSFGFKLYKRKHNEVMLNTTEWLLVVDHYDNN